MKKILSMFSVIVLLLAVGVVSAVPFTSTNTGGPYRWEMVDSTTANIDVTGTAEATVFSNQTVKHGYGYAVGISDSMGTDSVLIIVRTYTRKSGTLIGAATCDTIGSNDVYSTKLVDAVIGTRAMGATFNIVMKGINVTTVKRIKKAVLWRFKIQQTQVPWNVEQ